MLVNCVAYTQGQKLADIAIADISEHIRRPDTFVWVALKDPTSEELAAVQEEFDLHDLAIEDALKGDQRPKLEEYGSSLFVVMHTVEHEGEDLRVGEVAIFLGPQFLVSVRRHADQGFTEVRRRCETEPELLQHGPAYVLYALMDTVVDRYIPILDGLRVDFEGLEESIFAGVTTRAQIEALYSLKQRLMVLDHAVVPLLEVTGKLHGGRVPPICAGLGDYFRDISDHLLRERQSIDNLRDMLATAISVNLSLITLQESEVTKRLAAYAALIAVPTAIAGIYGMNFPAMPELHWKYGYPAVLAVMAVIDVYLVYLFRKADWL
jgi:magnesium transporter